MQSGGRACLPAVRATEPRASKGKALQRASAEVNRLENLPIPYLDIAAGPCQARAGKDPARAALRLEDRLGGIHFTFTEYRSYLLVAPVEVCAQLGELRATLAEIDGRTAWAGDSEVAKPAQRCLAIARQLPGVPALVFVTDGHEAPPLNPQPRPAFDPTPGEVCGLLVGVGQRRQRTPGRRRRPAGAPSARRDPRQRAPLGPARRLPAPACRRDRAGFPPPRQRRGPGRRRGGRVLPIG